MAHLQPVFVERRAFDIYRSIMLIYLNNNTYINNVKYHKNAITKMYLRGALQGYVFGKYISKERIIQSIPK